MPDPLQRVFGAVWARRWPLVGQLLGLGIAGLAVVVLWRVPFEASENAIFFIDLQAAESAWATLRKHSAQPGVMRSVAWATGKVLFDLAGDSRLASFRIFNSFLVLALAALFVRLARVRSARQAALLPVALMALFGMHPMHQAVRETALNMKLLMPVASLFVLSLAASEHRRWKDLAAIALFAYCLFSNELGFLVWAVLVSARIVGMRGVSTVGVIASTGILAWYLYLRFVVLPVGVPGLSERSSGFGFQNLDPAQLQALFGDNPLPFYAYNVVCAILGVLFSEPRNGAFVFVSEALGGAATPWTVLNVVTSTAGTVLLAGFALRRLRRWRARDLEHADQIFLVFIGVLVANGVITYPWLKDVTLSTAGVFYSLALFFALVDLRASNGGSPVPARRAVMTSLLVVLLSVGWSVRGLAFFVDQRRSAYRAQQDWVEVYSWLDSQGVTLEAPTSRRLIEEVREHQLATDVPRLRRSWIYDIDPYH